MGNIKSFCCRDNIEELDDGEERARILSDNNGSTNSLYNSSNPSQDDLSYGSLNNGIAGGGGAAGGKTMEQSALDKIYQRMAANVIDVAPGESMVIQTAEFIERQKAYQARLNQIKTPLPLRSSSNKVPRNPNNSTPDTSSTSRINNSISTAGANLTAFNNLNTTAANTTANNLSTTSTNAHSSGGAGGSSSMANTTSTSGIAGGNSPQPSAGKDKPRVEYEPISSEEVQLINEISDRTAKAIKGFKVTSDEPVVTCFKP